MNFTVHTSSDYHRRELTSLGWETTLCNTIADPHGPCRTVLGIDAAYGELLGDYLRRYVPFPDISHLVEVGGGYGWLMRDLLRRHHFPKVTMIDICPTLLAVQKETLGRIRGVIDFRAEDFLDTPHEMLRGADLVILNENVGDYPTITDLTRESLENREAAPAPELRAVSALFHRYGLPVPDQARFHVNIGALLTLEKLCRAEVPYIFLSEHSCEASVSIPYRDLIHVPASGNPECIVLKGHEEFTIRFSHLEKLAESYGYRTIRGPIADFIPFHVTPRVRAILKAPSPWRDEDEIVRYFLEDLFKYEYLLLAKETETEHAQDGGDLTCRRCGKCCLADFAAYVKDEDLERWRREGREDILAIIAREHAVWAGDHLISAADGRYLHGCPFLTWEGVHTTCAIYETRPAVCRNFKPASVEICPLWRP